ncbi:hypothetical protein ACOSJ1_CBNAJBGD_01554 [Enterococcus faecium]|nr:hypothetical protein OIU_05072 [Enterococcus faecium EnGen0039]ELB59245.1 hypothetical protein OKQ_05156 [Enterococcus faecium EnGen0052]CAH2253015.1 hypothetical protein ACOSJ1_CBNAJBGD_01554 [Enterococcus faecium]CAH2259702.1 hypothetical protein ACOSJ1_MOIKCCMD_01623 [Enterococcus faecium]
MGLLEEYQRAFLCVGKGSEKAADVGISAVFPILPAAVPLQEALQQATDNLHRTAKNIASLLQVVHFQGGNR